MWPESIPKTIHFFWNKNPLSFLRYLCFYSFRKLNPTWTMKLYIPKYDFMYSNKKLLPESDNNISNITGYIGPDFFNELEQLNVEINYVDFEDPQYNFKNELPYYYHAAFLKYFLLAKEGGVWSDTDIIFVKSMDDIRISKEYMFNGNHNKIDIGISFYSVKQMPNGFYYTGFLFSSGKNLFFEQLVVETRKKILEPDISYLSLDQYLFSDLYRNPRIIVNKYPMYSIYNIDEISVYSYTWFRLKEFYLKQFSFTKDKIDEIDFRPGIIGFHWFGGDPISDVYEKSRDLELKPSGYYSFDGFFPKLVDIYAKEVESIYNKYKQYQGKKISIVMSYYNRKAQLITTLKTIKESKHPNYEIIIVDDGSDENHRIEDLKNEYQFQLIRVEKQNKNYCNPCVPFNMAIKYATGDILLIQNPECCHIGDVLVHVQNNLNEKDYITYSCLALPSQVYNDKLSEILFDKTVPFWSRDKHLAISEKIIQPTIKNITNYTWYNHPIHNPSKLHFMSAIYRSKILEIGGFDEDYKDGTYYDDNDFLRDIEYKICLNAKIVPAVSKDYEFGTRIDYNVFCIHQYHTIDSVIHLDNTSKSIDLQNKNELLFKEKHISILSQYLIKKLQKNNLIGLSIKVFNNTKVERLNIDSFKVRQHNLTHSSNNDGFRWSIQLPKDIIYLVDHGRLKFEEKMIDYYNKFDKILIFNGKLCNPPENKFNIYVYNGSSHINLGRINHVYCYFKYKGQLSDNWRLYVRNIDESTHEYDISYLITDAEIYLDCNLLDIPNIHGETISNNQWKYKKIPKNAFTYWAGPMSKLHYLSIRSAVILNPDWEIILYQPKQEYIGKNTWETNEHSIKYCGKDYRKYLRNLNLKILDIDFEKIGFRNDLPEVYKSNYITYYHLSNQGGVWFDADVLFIRPLNELNLSGKLINGDFDTIEVVISYEDDYHQPYFSTGILMSAPKNDFFSLILNTLKKKIDLKVYMSATNLIYPLLFKNIQGVKKVFPTLNYADLGMDIFYPLKWNEMDILFESNHGIERISNNVIGIHWFNGSDITEKFLNSEKYNSDILINQIIKKYDLTDPNL